MTVPTVSVLVKAYNHAPYVRHTIESVLSQSFQDFEIVVADDGSNDGTLDILRSFTDPRINLEAHPRNLGISGAMNACIARARGRYLAILNTDDWALPDRLHRQVSFLDENPNISLVFGLPRPVGENDEPVAPYNDFHLPLTFPDFSSRTWLRQFFFGGNCLCAPTAMIRREAYAEVGPYDRRFTNLQDFDMWIRMLIAGHNIHLLPDELTAYRIRAGNANMGAPRLDSMLRSTFEITKILKRFVGLDPERFEHIFGEEARQSSTSDAPVALRVAELARCDPRIEYQNFALTVLHDSAQSDGDFDRLRVLSGSMDALGLHAIQTRDRRIEADQEAEQQRALSAARDQHIRELESILAAVTQEVEHLRSEAVVRHADVGELEAALAGATQEGERLRDDIAARDLRIGELEPALAASGIEAAALREQLAGRDARVAELEPALAAARIEAAMLREDLEGRNARIAQREILYDESALIVASLSHALAEIRRTWIWKVDASLDKWLRLSVFGLTRRSQQLLPRPARKPEI